MKNFTEIDPYQPELVAARKRAKLLCQQLNALRADQHKARKPIYQALFGKVSSAYIEPNFFCDYGKNIFLGEKFYANHNCVIWMWVKSILAIECYLRRVCSFMARLIRWIRWSAP